MSEASARGIFERLIGRTAISSGKFTEAEIEEKASAFARQFPVERFTPAQVQSFLQECRGDPDKAIAGIEFWAKETLKEEETKKMKETLKAAKKKAEKSKPKVNGVPPTPATTSAAESVINGVSGIATPQDPGHGSVKDEKVDEAVAKLEELETDGPSDE